MTSKSDTAPRRATENRDPKQIVVMTGVTGLIGRWTAAALTRDGHAVLGLARNARARSRGVAEWVTAHGGDGARLTLLDADLGAPGLGLGDADREACARATAVHHIGAAMAWNMSRAEAHAQNVAPIDELVRLCTGGPTPKRFVHVSGYLVGHRGRLKALGVLQGPGVAPSSASDEAISRLYKRLGGYEASKIEAELRLRAAAAASGVPLTIIHPATVIGHSQTGETDQLFGLAGVIEGLKKGEMPAIPGGPRDRIPFVAIDYLAEFLARAPFHPAIGSGEYTVLDQASPTLAGTVGLVAQALGVRAPRMHAPLWLVRAMLVLGLGKSDGVSRESLSFINALEFDTASADQAAAALGLEHVDVRLVLRRTVDHWLKTHP